MTATRAIARAHKHLVGSAGIPCAAKFQNRAGRTVYHYPEWVAILLQIACITLEMQEDTTTERRIWIYRTVDDIPRDRRDAVVDILRRAKTSTALQQRLLGISAWADLESNDDTYKAQAYKLWGGLWSDSLQEKL